MDTSGCSTFETSTTRPCLPFYEITSGATKASVLTTPILRGSSILTIFTYLKICRFGCFARCTDKCSLSYSSKRHSTHTLTCGRQQRKSAMEHSESSEAGVFDSAPLFRPWEKNSRSAAGWVDNSDIRSGERLRYTPCVSRRWPGCYVFFKHASREIITNQRANAQHCQPRVARSPR